MKHRKFFMALSFVCMFIMSAVLFAACTPELLAGAEPPFAQRFTGVVGSYDESGNLTFFCFRNRNRLKEGST